MDEVVFLEKPELNRPHLVVAFGGWPDAAEVATRTVAHLIGQLKAWPFAEINGEEFFDFTKSRPEIVVEDGLLRQLRLPTIESFFWKSPSGGHDIILMRGIEPELRWKTFADIVVALAREFGVTRIIALGGLYDNVPHTRAPKVSGLVNQAHLKELLLANGVSLTTYRGPAGVHSMLLAASEKAGIEMISLWGHSPFYLRSEANPRMCIALVSMLNRFLAIQADVEKLRRAAEQMDRALGRLMSENPRLRAQLEKLEEQYDAESVSDGPSEGAEQVVRDIEDFLHREGGKTP